MTTTPKRNKVKSVRGLRKQLREAKHQGEETKPLVNNLVAKYMNEYNKPKTHANEKKKAKKEFEDWEAAQDWDDNQWDGVQPNRFYPGRK